VENGWWKSRGQPLEGLENSRAGRVLHSALAKGKMGKSSWKFPHFSALFIGSAKVNISISDLATLLW